jgi:hypothetical protein
MVERLPGALDAMARPADDRALGRESSNEHVADGVEWRAVCSEKTSFGQAAVRSASNGVCASHGHRSARGGRKLRFALGQSRYDRPMLSLLYLVVRALVRLLASGGRGRDDDRSS